MMERRGFLKGLFGGVTSAGLVIAASQSDIEAFASPLVRDAPLLLDRPAVAPARCGEHLYNASGELVAIITELTLTRDPIEVTHAWDDKTMYVPGRLEIAIRAVGVGSVEWAGRTPMLRGRR